MAPHSSILYQNPTSTVFLLDIPTSITLAQHLSAQQHQHNTQLNQPPRTPKEAEDEEEEYPRRTPTRQTKTKTKNEINPKRHLLSTPPLKEPYTASTEPKSEAARARVLARIPRSERVVQGRIGKVVLRALEEIRGGYGYSWECSRSGSGGERWWCCERDFLDRDEKYASEVEGREAGAGDGAGDGVWIAEKKKRKRKWTSSSTTTTPGTEDQHKPPPVILSPGENVNLFESEAEIRNVLVRNPSAEDAKVEFFDGATYLIPPLSSFVLCHLPMSGSSVSLHQKNREEHRKNRSPIPLLESRKYNLILLDPPWSNRSVRRSGHYKTQSYRYDESQLLTDKITDILETHSVSVSASASGEGEEGVCIAAIWTTNAFKSRNAAYASLRRAGFCVVEEWIWVKVTVLGEPVGPVDGVWRRPFEVLVVGRKREQGRWLGVCPGEIDDDGDDDGIRRRVIAAVPDVHSRKPNLREVFEKVFFAGIRYEALEVFARNLTAGWWAVGDEVVKFNEEAWWTPV